MDTLYRDVSIFASCDKDPVLRTSRLTLAGHSALLASYLGELSVCDGCETSLAIIIADEDRDTVRAALSKVVSVSGMTVIKDPVRTKSLSKRLGFCDSTSEEVQATTFQPENMETNREASAASTSSRLTEPKHPRIHSNTSLLAEMDLSMTVDESFDASVTTQEGSNLDTELPRKDRQPEAREGSISPPVLEPEDTDWEEPGHPRKKKKTGPGIEKVKPCDICGKLLTSSNLSKHKRNVHGLNSKPPPSRSIINSFATSQLLDTELPREDRQSPTAREGSISPPVPEHKDTDWEEPGPPRKKKKTDYRVGKFKPCDTCGKLITVNHMRRHEKTVHGLYRANPPSQSVINSFATSQLLSKESKVDLENINLKSLKITPDDPCIGRRKITLTKEELGTYRIHGMQEQICPICGKMSSDRYNLVRHCSAQHFQGHLMQYVKKGSSICLLCDTDHKHTYNLLGHIGGKHKRDEVERLIKGHTDGGLQETHKQHEEDNQNKCLSKSEQATVNDSKEYSLECFLDDCNFETSKRLKLYRHYSTEHFRSQLGEHLNGENSMKCKFCNILIRKTSDMIAHIGSVHGKVEKYIPKEHRIPLSAKSIPSSSINGFPENGDENSNSIKDERSPSPSEHIISVETVALPDDPPSTHSPDDDCLVDLKIEMVESVPSDNNPSQIQEVNTESKQDYPENGSDLRRVLDSDSSDSENED